MADLIALQDDALAAGADPRDVAGVSQDNITATGPFTPTAIKDDVPVGGEFEIDFDETEEEDLDLGTAGGTGHNYTDSVTASLVALADGDEDADPMETFRNRKAALLNQTPEEVIAQATQAAKTRAIAETLEFADDTNSAAVAQIIQEDIQALDGPFGLQEAAARRLQVVQTQKEKEAIVRNAIALRISQKLNEVGALESFYNRAETILLPDFRKDLSDLPGVDFTNASEGFKQLILDYRTMSPEEKLAAFPTYEEMFTEAFDGNQLKAASALQQLAGLGDISDIDFDLFLETLGLAFVPFDAISTIVRSSNAIRFSRNLNNAEAAGDLNAGALTSPEAAEALGVSQMDAARSLSPFRWEPLTPSSTDGIASETVQAIENIRKTVRDQMEQLGRERIQRSVLDDQEQIAARFNATDKLAEQLKETFGYSVKEAKFSKQDEKGFSVEFELNDDTGGLTNIKTKPVRVDYTVNDLGGFDLVAANPVQTGVGSPSTWMNKLSKGSVDRATTAGFTEGQFQQSLFKTYKTATKGLGKQQINDIDDVLLAGDESGKVYTLSELMYEGVNTNTGVKRLSAKQAGAYYAMRDMFDGLWNAKNTQMREQMIFDGNRHVDNFRGQRVIGKPTNTRQLDENITRVYTNEGQIKGIVDVTPQMRKDLQEGKLTLYRLNNQVEGGDDVVEWALAAKDKDIPSIVMNRITGYVPLVRKDASWFVRASVPRILNGKNTKIARTVRAFDNKTDAEAWAAQQKKETGIDHAANFDRELPTEAQEELLVKSMGGLFGSARSEREILFGFNGDKPTRMNAVDSLSRNIAHISNAVPMNEFRMEAVGRWLNSANKFLEKPGDFNSPLKIGAGTKEAVALEDSRAWIRDQMRIPTPDEERWAGMMVNRAVAMEGNKFFKDGVGKGARLAIQNLSHVDPYAAARAGAYHALLGWFNPSGLIVQGSGAAVAFSLDPTRAPKILSQGLFLRAGLFVKNDRALENIAASSSALGLDAKEMLAAIKDYRRTGLADSLKTSADYNASLNGFSIDAGSLKRVADAGLMFQREGELFARTYAWLSARDRFVSKNPKRKGQELTDKEIDQITKDSLALTLNLARANRANWQKGAMSIPTQFLQINAKFLEAMAPNTVGSGVWTNREKIQVLTGQLALFGAAGVPLGNYFLRGALENSGGQISEEDRDAYEQGMMGMFMSMLFGEPVEIATRTSLVSGLEQMVANTIKGDKSMGEVIVGAAGVVPNRVFEAVANVTPILRDPANMNWTKDEAMIVATEFGRVISTFRNLHKGYMMERLGQISTADGKTIDTVDWGEEWKGVVAQAAGFTPSRVQDAYEYQEYVKQMGESRKSTLRELVNIQNIYLRGELEDPARKKNFDNMMSMTLMGLPPSEQIKVQETWANQFMNPETVLGKAQSDAFKLLLSTGELNPSPLGQGVPLDIITEED